jgi:uncharacterized protein YqfA (UPF0365 family)
LGGAQLSLLELIGMRLRGNPPGLIVDALLVLTHRGVRATAADVESTYMAHKGTGISLTELVDLVQDRLGKPG